MADFVFIGGDPFGAMPGKQMDHFELLTGPGGVEVSLGISVVKVKRPGHIPEQ